MKILKIQSTIVPNFNMKLFLTSLVGFPEQQTNKQTNAKKTEENEMPFPLYIWNNDTPPYAHCVRFGGNNYQDTSLH